MKVLVIHNRYRTSAPSGEDAACAAECALLERRGVRVVRYERRNDELPGRLAAATEAVWSRSARRELAALLRRERPDVAHVHNLWYRISPSAYAACQEAGVPVVQTLHNFRMVCANALLLRGGGPCEDCLGRGPWRAVRHGCFRGSRAATLPLAFALWLHGRRRTWERVARFIALSEFARAKFVACGVPADRISVKPNCVPDPGPGEGGRRSGALFVGRLSAEKGVAVLLEAAARGDGPPLAIVGDGPLRVALERAAAGGRVAAVGALDRAACLRAMRAAACVVVPSICYENSPLVVAEAFACGTPVIASRLGALAELVDEGRTGLLFTPGDAGELAAAMAWMEAHPDARAAMGREARAQFERRHDERRNFDLLTGIYREARQ